MIKIALPKGRIADETLEIFKEIFKRDFKFKDRKLIMKDGEFEFLMVRNQDIPTYVYGGAADLGVVGLDVLEESRPDVLRLLDLKFGKCKICLGYPKNRTPDLTKPNLKIATKMPNITKSHFSSLAIPVQIIKLYGSIELAPLVGLSDAIVDIVETGVTMEQNGLEVGEVLMQSSAHLIANKISFITKKDEILSLYHKINGIIDVKFK